MIASVKRRGVHNDVGTTDARALLPLQSPGAEHEPPQSPGRREPRAVRSGPATGDGMSTKPWELQEQVRGFGPGVGQVAAAQGRNDFAGRHMSYRAQVMSDEVHGYRSH